MTHSKNLFMSSEDTCPIYMISQGVLQTGKHKIPSVMLL